MREKLRTIGVRTPDVHSICFFILVFICHFSYSQGNRYEFLQHLNSIKAYQEGVTYIDHLFGNEKFDQDSADSLHYLKGKFNYYLASQKESISALSKVSDKSPFYLESHLLEFYQRAYLEEFAGAIDGFTKLKNFEGAENIVALQLSGLGLLKRNEKEYLNGLNQWAKVYPAGALKFDEINRSINNFKPKSAFAAGALSAVIPGLGKIYLGKVGEGITTLLATSIFALQAMEGYNKDGIRSARFIFFSSVFTGFYISNIVGSTLAVRVRKEEFNAQTNNTILVAMHVPLRILFD